MRAALFALLAILVAACAAPAPAVAPPDRSPVASVRLVAHRSATCGCCHEHLAHLRAAGWDVDDVVEQDVTVTKDRIGIPVAVRSCHTTIAGSYWVEGHVPASAIQRLLSERPDLDGIAVPGMPIGSPGMGGEPDPTLEILGIKDGQVVGVFAVGV